MKIEMPNLKRCKLEEQEEEPDSESYGCSANQKKKRSRVNGLYSLGGDAEDFSSVSGSWCSEGSYWNGGGEVQSNSNSNLNGETAQRGGGEGPRPPLLRSSRGRLHTLPSRFSDSVLESWKNRGIKVEDTDSSFDEDDKSFVGEQERKGDNTDNYGHEVNVEIEKDGFVKTESNTSGISFEGALDQKVNNNGNGAERRKEVYKPEDFALGDIVWAKCGKRYPAWPAVVIDPILQAPKSVLSCCVPGALCVMFFGFSKNGTQRVIVFYFSPNWMKLSYLLCVLVLTN